MPLPERSAEQAVADALLGERADRISHLISVLSQERMSAVQQAVDRNSATLSETQLHLQRLDVALFGPNGQNGLNSQVKALSTQIEEMRTREIAELKDLLRDTKASIGRWALGLLPVIVAIASLVAYIHG